VIFSVSAYCYLPFIHLTVCFRASWCSHDTVGTKAASKGITEHPTRPPNVSTSSPSPRNDVEEHQDIDIEDIFGAGSPDDGNAIEEKVDAGFDINVPQQNNTDDEIADVDDSGDEADKGLNAAEALRAQKNADGREKQTSSSSSSSGSGSSGSGSSSSSSSEDSDEDSVNSIWKFKQLPGGI